MEDNRFAVYLGLVTVLFKVVTVCGGVGRSWRKGWRVAEGDAFLDKQTDR